MINTSSRLHMFAAQSSFPKISNNFEKHTPLHTKGRTGMHNLKSPIDHIPQPSQNHQNNYEKEQIPEPAPFTVVQSFAPKLRQNQAQNGNPKQLTLQAFTIRQGLLAAIFKKGDFMINLATQCKYTLVWKFSNTMPKIDLIRRNSKLNYLEG
ncbi:hypothetical protein H5410_064126 [Solanum commersonii]|uniref:Uncharacterized protein n=1 Tax=Solanum commersonii TaxID=4109 RepID=A0A9J5W0B2_SOLCO|nr:hypothetical protein H5410_064126 [Solanum commersonii]